MSIQNRYFSVNQYCANPTQFLLFKIVACLDKYMRHMALKKYLYHSIYSLIKFAGYYELYNIQGQYRN